MKIQVTEADVLRRLMELCVKDEATPRYYVKLVVNAFRNSTLNLTSENKHNELQDYTECLNRVYRAMDYVSTYDGLTDALTRVGGVIVLDALIMANH